MPTKNTHSLTVQLSSRKLVDVLQDIAKRLGYIQTRGGGVGRGSVSQLLEAIAAGEVKICKS